MTRIIFFYHHQVLQKSDHRPCDLQVTKQSDKTEIAKKIHLFFFPTISDQLCARALSFWISRASVMLLFIFR